MTQRLGLLSNVNKLGHPTKKIISNQWLLSAILIVPVVLFEHVFGTTKNPPFISMRFEGSYFSATRNKKERLYKSPPEELMLDNWKILLLESDRSSKKIKEASSNLWQLINNCGGISFDAAEGHTSYVKAVVYKNRQVFLIGDPKKSDYRIYNLDEFANFLRKNQSKVAHLYL